MDELAASLMPRSDLGLRGHDPRRWPASQSGPLREAIDATEERVNTIKQEGKDLATDPVQIDEAEAFKQRVVEWLMSAGW